MVWFPVQKKKKHNFLLQKQLLMTSKFLLEMSVIFMSFLFITMKLHFNYFFHILINPTTRSGLTLVLFCHKPVYPFSLKEHKPHLPFSFGQHAIYTRCLVLFPKQDLIITLPSPNQQPILLSNLYAKFSYWQLTKHEIIRY